MKPTTETATASRTIDGGGLTHGEAESSKHSALMLLHLLRWGTGRLEQIEAHLVYEHEPGHSISNSSHRTDILNLVRDYHRGVWLIHAGRCQDPRFVALLQKATQVEVAIGSKLYQAGINKDAHPVPGLVDRLKPVIHSSYEELESLRQEVEQFRATHQS